MSERLQRVKQAARDWWQSRAWPRRPEILNVEITAACDAKCIHCPRLDMDRPMKAMPAALFRKLVADAAALGIPSFCPNGFGEICTLPVPVLEEYFGYLPAGRFKVLINTNGNRMTEDRAAVFIRHGVNLVNVTIDGATAETAEAIRKNLKFHQIEENVKRLIAMRDAAGRKFPRVRVGMIAMPQTIPEIEPFLARWRGVADFVGIGGFSSRLASVDPPNAASLPVIQLGEAAAPAAPAPADPAPNATACVLPFRDLNIWADGKAVLCCEDWNEEYVVGDLNTETLDQIWHGPRLAEVRRKHMARVGHEVALCAKCNNWQQPTRGARLWA
jgi:hypothetical protein